MSISKKNKKKSFLKTLVKKYTDLKKGSMADDDAKKIIEDHKKNDGPKK